MLGWATQRDSVTFDELGHFAAGVSHWYGGSFSQYRVNPPFVRLVACAPTALRERRLELGPYGLIRDPIFRPEFPSGRRVAASAGPRYFDLVTTARWAAIPFSLLGAAICLVWARELYGIGAGTLGMILWVLCPNVLAHGHLITPDIGAASMGAAAAYTYWNWLRGPTLPRAVASGAVLGLAELTKFTWVVSFILWPALWLAYRLMMYRDRDRGATWRIQRRREALHLAGMLLLALWVINVGYGFEGSFKRLGDFNFLSRAPGGTSSSTRDGIEFRNRFAHTPLSGLPIPLPENYVRGIDYSKWEFEEKKWSYLRGEWKRGGWWYYYLYALLVKVPLGTWALLALATVVTLFRRGYSAPLRDELVLLLPAVAVLILVSSQTGYNHHLRYVLPAFPFFFIWISKVARSFELRHRTVAVIAVIALSWSVFSSLSVYPHSLSYFNELAGGPKNGHYHLVNSNIDWGQDLHYLKRWQDQHPEAKPLYFSYDLPLIDPKIAGIDYRPMPGAAALVPGWYAISVNHLHWFEGHTRHFLNLTPAAMAGYSIYIYHVTPDDAGRLRRFAGEEVGS